MSVSERTRRQEEKLAAQAQQQKQPPPSTQSDPATPQLVVDLQALREMIKEVVRAELQAHQAAEQPAQPETQELRHTLQSLVRAELQPLQAAVTILTNAIQAQTDAMISREEQEEPLPTAAPARRTDDDAGIEGDEQVYPPDGVEEEPEEAGTEEGNGAKDLGEEEGYPYRPPRPESPTHRLRRPGPIALLLGDGIVCQPTQGVRRWERHA